jgi:pimeloyl-ACP methyl ester carboxylesterase
MSAGVARRVAEASNEEMGRNILALYRSAAQPAMAELGKDFPKAAAKPGLVIIPTEDGFTGGEAMARRSAERASAQVAVLDGLGHWWMCEDPKRGAEVISNFLDSLD